MNLEKSYFIKKDWKKFLIIFIIANLVNFNFATLKLLKDSLIISNLGVNSLPTIKILFVLPASILFTVIYGKLSDRFDGKSLFIILLILFGIFFLGYNIFFINSKNLIAYYTFYTVSELWGTVILSTAMWAYFNDICNISKARKFYVLLSGIQIGALVASLVIEILIVKYGSFRYSTSALYLVSVACFLNVIIILIFSRYLENENYKTEKEVDKDKSIFRGVELVLKSRYMLLIFLITLCYNFSLIVVEFIWKSNINLIYRTESDMILFNSRYSLLSTLITALLSILISTKFMNYFGILISLTIFPIIFGISSTFYFFLFLNPKGGALQWILTKATQYSLADPAKQILYIPLKNEEKYKAKSFIDIFGARGGKSLASLFNMMFLTNVKNIHQKALKSYPVVLLTVLLWTFSALALGMLFNDLNKKIMEEK